MRNFLKRFAVGIGLVAVLLAVAAYLVHRSMQTGPAFYQEALLIDASAGSAAGEQLEQQLVELHNEVLREEQWSATFTEEQINGWLAYGLPKRFAHVLPSTVSDPRVAIDKDGLKLGFRYLDEHISGIITLHLDAYVAKTDNEIGIVVDHLNAGLVPLPISKWTERITNTAANHGIPLRWTQQNGAPVALVNLRLHLPDQPERTLIIKTIAFLKGKLFVSGTSDTPLDEQSIHGFAQSQFGGFDTGIKETVHR